MTEAELQNYILSRYPHETIACEWKAFRSLKSQISGRVGEDAISYISAISNMDGGVLILGIEDKTGRILGIDDTHDFTPENLPFRLVGNCTNLSSEGLWVESHLTSDTNKLLWIIHIPKHLPRIPVYAHKKAWQRIADNLVELNDSRKQAILTEPLSIGEDWSAEILPDATLDDLEPRAIAEARLNFKNKYSELADDVDTWTDITFLNRAKLAIKGKITRTAILLLGKPESEVLISPSTASIMWILTDRDGNQKDYRRFSCPFLLTVDEVFHKIRNLKVRYIKDDSLFPDEVDQY